MQLSKSLTSLKPLPLKSVAVAIATVLSLAGCASTPLVSGKDNPAVQAVTQIDPTRYAGKWYEIARLPNRFQNQCQGNVTATYAQDDRDGLSVTNSCLTVKGETDEAVGRALRTTDTEAKLKVSFLPSLLSKLSWLPFGWGEYWVLDLPGDYSHSLVGTPDNKYLWVLSRQAQMSEPTYFKLMQKAATMGFDTNAVVRTPQGISGPQASK